MTGTRMQVRHMLHFIETWMRGDGGCFSECAGLMIAADEDSSVLDEPVWLYAYEDRITFTNVEGDIQGLEGSSFTAELEPSEGAE